MARKKKVSTEVFLEEPQKPSFYRVKLKDGEAMVIIPSRTLFADDEGFVLVTPEEYEILKSMGVCA